MTKTQEFLRERGEWLEEAKAKVVATEGNYIARKSTLKEQARVEWARRCVLENIRSREDQVVSKFGKPGMMRSGYATHLHPDIVEKMESLGIADAYHAVYDLARIRVDADPMIKDLKLKLEELRAEESAIPELSEAWSAKREYESAVSAVKSIIADIELWKEDTHGLRSMVAVFAKRQKAVESNLVKAEKHMEFLRWLSERNQEEYLPVVRNLHYAGTE